MVRDVVTVDPEMTVQEFIERVLEKNPSTSFPVARDRRLHGMLLLSELRSEPRDRWSELRVKEVMRPVNESMFIKMTAAHSEARSLLGRNGVELLAVLDADGLIVGSITVKELGGHPAGAVSK